MVRKAAVRTIIDEIKTLQLLLFIATATVCCCLPSHTGEDQRFHKYPSHKTPWSRNSSTTPAMVGEKAEKAFISTHILDTTLGMPGANVPIELLKLNGNQWVLVSSGLTNADGRYEIDLMRIEQNLGSYKLHFAIEGYFRGLQVDSLYPFIEVIFDVKSTARYYHIPLLLQAFGYTTYRGS